jgi:hypothetical protein
VSLLASTPYARDIPFSFSTSTSRRVRGRKCSFRCKFNLKLDQYPYHIKHKQGSSEPGYINALSSTDPAFEANAVGPSFINKRRRISGNTKAGE